MDQGSSAWKGDDWGNGAEFARLEESGQRLVDQVTVHSSPPCHGLLQMLRGLGTRPDKSTERNPSSTAKYKDRHKEPCKYLEAGIVSRGNVAPGDHQRLGSG